MSDEAGVSDDAAGAFALLAGALLGGALLAGAALDDAGLLDAVRPRADAAADASIEALPLFVVIDPVALAFADASTLDDDLRDNDEPVADAAPEASDAADDFPGAAIALPELIADPTADAEPLRDAGVAADFLSAGASGAFGRFASRYALSSTAISSDVITPAFTCSRS